MIKVDTIAAIATAMSDSGIGIIRVSGEQAFFIIDQIYRGKKSDKVLSRQKSHTVHYGFIFDGDEKIDEVLVLLMRGPHSYTGEDTIEIHCHGGVLMVKRVLETVLSYGARPADPGEFTKRAYLNGRMDLSQAEAVIDVIHAKNDYALKSSVKQMEGILCNQIKELRSQILYEIALIESALDDPEHISLDGYGQRLVDVLSPVEEVIKRLHDSFDHGRVIAEGISTVILGKPNAGKSSLLNVLLGEERAIVTSIAGTTRDTLEEHIQLSGISLNIIDTAGIRDTDDVVEKIGVEKAKQAAFQADLILYVVDGIEGICEEDLKNLSLIQDKKVLVLLNKSDLISEIDVKVMEERVAFSVILISAKTKDGVEQVEKKIQDLFYGGELNFNDEIYITNIRHKTALKEAFTSLSMVKHSIELGMPEDFYSIDLMNAYEQLGLIIGESVGDDLVNEIFSKFCMGK